MIEVRGDEIVGRTRAMATDIVIRAPQQAGTDPHQLSDAIDAALAVFAEVHTVCTRFDPNSPLMRANSRPNTWHRVPPVLFDALVEAHWAHDATRRRFDPRVYEDLVELGYDRSLPFSAGPVSVVRGSCGHRGPRPPWRPRFRGATREVLLGPAPVELGGIGKGLAVRWAATLLRRRTPSYLIEAGGDCFCAGVAPGGVAWRVGIEDPAGGAEPLAVLALSDRSCTTSSVRVRRWLSDGRPAHHLIDPRTGRPGGHGLQAVTVVGVDPARDEVWSKSLFLGGAESIASEAERRGFAAFWVRRDGSRAMSSRMRRYVIWEAP